MKNVIFIAPPAAGKGTFSEKLKKHGYIHISTGDMLREEIKNNTPLGNKLETIMNKGELVSDEIVFDLITNKLNNIDNSFILDGFPRTLEQAKYLTELFNKLNIVDYEVIYLDVSLEVAIKRALGRLTCVCGASYNKYNDLFKPKVEWICDKCGKELTQRNDDNEESFKVRFNTFLEKTNPIINYYEDLSKLHRIDATLDIDEQLELIKNILDI